MAVAFSIGDFVGYVKGWVKDAANLQPGVVIDHRSEYLSIRWVKDGLITHSIHRTYIRHIAMTFGGWRWI